MRTKVGYGRSLRVEPLAQPTMRVMLGLVFATTMTVFSNMYITQPVLPIIGAEFGLTPAQAGLSVSALVLAIAASSTFYGVLSDRVGRKPVMVCSVVGLALPTFLCAFAPTFGLLVALRAGQGLLIPGYTAIAITYLQEEAPARTRSLALSYYVMASVAGGFSGRLVGGVITDLTGDWRLSFVFFALVDLALGALLWRFLPVSRHFAGYAERVEAVAGAETVEAPPQRGSFQFGALLEHLRNPALLSVYIIGFSLMFCFLGLFTYLPYYLGRAPFNLPTLWISSAYVVYLVGMFSAPFSARQAERLSRPTILKRGFVIMMVGCLLTLVPTLPTVLLGLVALCFGMFACQSTATALVGESVRDPRKRGSAVSLYQMFFYVGASCGGFVPGLLWQFGGWPPVVGGVLAVLSLGLASLVWLYR